MRTALAGAALALLAAGCTGTTAPAPAGRRPSRAAVAPFMVKPLFCGRYSAVQRDRWSDYGGLIFTYTNTGHRPAAVQVRVSFVKGTTVLGSNVTAYEPVIRPGQTGTAEVGYPAASVPAHFTCQVTQISSQ